MGMLTQPLMTQALELWPVNAHKKAYAEYCTHLAVNLGRNGEIDQGKNYDHKGGQARRGVDLPKGEIQTRKPKVSPIYRHVPISSIDNVYALGKHSTRS